MRRGPLRLVEDRFNLDQRSIIITGAAGFIGSHLCEKFLNQGYQVFGLDNFSTGLMNNIQHLKKLPEGRHFFFFNHDVSLNWKRAFDVERLKNLTHILHFASPASPPIYQRIPKETLWANALGLEHSLRWADRLGARVVYASTSEVYGDPKVSPQPETYWGNVNSFGPRSCYDEGKRFGEALLYSHNHQHKTRHGLVRIFNTYGPRMNPADGRVIINFLTQALRGEPLTIYGSGRQTRSFCYVSDLVEGITRYTLRDFDFPMNIGNPSEFTILQLTTEIQRVFGRKLEVVHLPPASDDPQQRRPDISLAKKNLAGWQPQVPLREGLKDMIQWIVRSKDFKAVSNFKKAVGA